MDEQEFRYKDERPTYEKLSHCLVRVASQLWHFCPACNEIHQFAIDKPFSNGHKWTWDGNAIFPTFLPSMNIRIGPEVCHYHLKAGKIEYLADCTHALRGLTVELPAIPERYWSHWR